MNIWSEYTSRALGIFVDGLNRPDKPVLRGFRGPLGLDSTASSGLLRTAASSYRPRSSQRLARWCTWRAPKPGYRRPSRCKRGLRLFGEHLRTMIVCLPLISTHQAYEL